MKYLVGFSRGFVGVLFILSGWIKSNDTLGFAYKLDEYFDVFAEDFSWFSGFFLWLKNFSLAMSMLICIGEIVLGVAAILGIKIKQVTNLMMAMIVFFTFLTFYSWMFDKVKDCGCFGDAIKGITGKPLTPFGSFIKDLILLVFISIMFFYRNTIKPLVPEKIGNISLISASVLSTIFTIQTYRHLPMIDFRPYKVGDNISKNMETKKGGEVYIWTYEDKDGNEIKYVQANNMKVDPKSLPEGMELLPPYDQIVAAGLKNTGISDPFTPDTVAKPEDPKIEDFRINTTDGEELAEMILNDDRYYFFLVMYELGPLGEFERDATGQVQRFVPDEGIAEQLQEIIRFSQESEQAGVPFYGMTSSFPEEVDQFRTDLNCTFPIYLNDDKQLKAMVRSNPGLMLLRKGTIIEKWHENDMPSFTAIKEKYLK